MSGQHVPSPLPGSDIFGPASAVWGSDEWRRHALQWVDEQFAAHGISRAATSPTQPKLRPWSTLMVIDTDGHGRFWFKASLPELAPETHIMTVLRKQSPGAVPEPLAVDHERGWSLTLDLGPSMRDAGDAADVSKASALMRHYARIQRGSTAFVPDLVAAGVPQRSPQDIARELLGMRISPAVAHGVRAAAGRLDALGLPMTIQHGDLHAGNVYITNPAPAFFSAIIADWNDASIGNPLCSLLVPLRRIREDIPGADGIRAAERLTRAYLSCWSDVATSAELKASLVDAMIIAKAGELVNWRRALARATREEKATWGQYGAASLNEITASLERIAARQR